MQPGDTPRVSICLPVYNGEEFLAAAIESALEQSLDDFELIVVDDLSRDGSVAIAERYAQTDKRVKLFINPTNQGLFANYNACLERCTGEFIKPFAQDDRLHPQCLEKLVAVLEENPQVALVSCAKRWIDSQGNEMKILRPFPEARIIPGRDVILYNLLCFTNWVGEPSTVLFRSARADAGFDTEFYHYGDLDCWLRILDGSYYAYSDDVLCDFRRHGDAETNRNLKGMFFALDLLRLGRKYRHVLADLGESEEHFFKRLVETLALNLDHLVTQHGLSASEAASIQTVKTATADRDEKVEHLEKELAGFKEIAFHQARYLTELLAEVDHLKRTRVDELELWESEMSKLLTSPSWKVTAPLRAVKDIFRRNPENGGRTTAPPSA